jgi:glycosyltransferase involved in cell wall biosynthesis
MEMTHRLKILQVIEASATGVGRHVLDLVDGLVARGHEVCVAYSPLRADDTFVRTIRNAGCMPFPIAMECVPHPSDMRAVSHLLRLARIHGPFDIIHGHSSKGGFLARIVGKLLGCPVFYTPHAIKSLDCTMPGVKRAPFWIAEAVLARLTEKTIACSRFELDHIRSFRVPDRKLAMVSNAIEPFSDAAGRAQARSRLGLKEEDVAIGFVGRLSRQKGLTLLLHAIATLPRDLGFRLVVVGAGPLAASGRELAASLDIAHRIDWLGAVAARPLLRGFDIFVQPSFYEGASYSLLEAISAGLPVIASNTGSVPDLVRHGETGFVVPIGDQAGLAAALSRLVADAELRRGMSRTIEHDSPPEVSGVQTMVAALEGLYGEVAQEHWRKSAQTGRAAVPATTPWLSDKRRVALDNVSGVLKE